MMKIFLAIITTLLVTACAPYSLKQSGPHSLGPLSFETSSNWNKYNMANAGRNVEIWTADGSSLNSLMIFKGVKDEQSLFRTASKANAMPLYSKDMLPQEVMELVQSSLRKFYGEANVLLEADGLRPMNFVDSAGFGFDLKFTNESGLRYLGKVAAVSKNEALYMMIYSGTEMHYFEQHDQEFEQILASASM